MKKLIYGLILMAGCCTLNADYIKQDRQNYETLAPRIRKMLRSTAEYSPAQKQDIEDRLNGWDVRTSQGILAVEEKPSE